MTISSPGHGTIRIRTCCLTSELVILSVLDNCPKYALLCMWWWKMGMSKNPRIVLRRNSSSWDVGPGVRRMRMVRSILQCNNKLYISCVYIVCVIWIIVKKPKNRNAASNSNNSSNNSSSNRNNTVFVSILFSIQISLLWSDRLITFTINLPSLMDSLIPGKPLVVKFLSRSGVYSIFM